MLLNKKRLSKKVIIIIALIVVLVAGIITAAVYSLNGSNQEATNSPYVSGDKDKNNQKSSSAKGDTNTSSLLPAQNESVPRNTEASIALTDVSQSDGQVHALASTSNMTVTSCVYSFTSDGAKPVVRETKNLCEQVSIPSVEFEKIGTYTLTVTAYDSSSRIETSKQVNIE